MDPLCHLTSNQISASSGSFLDTTTFLKEFILSSTRLILSLSVLSPPRACTTSRLLSPPLFKAKSFNTLLKRSILSQLIFSLFLASLSNGLGVLFNSIDNHHLYL